MVLIRRPTWLLLPLGLCGLTSLLAQCTSSSGISPPTGDAGASFDAGSWDASQTSDASAVVESGSPSLDAAGDATEDGAAADSAPSVVVLSGALAKGPFIQGSTVVVSPTDSVGNPTGTNFQTSTTDDLGDFSLTFTYQGPVELLGTGFYFNEQEGALSTAQITLKGFAQVTQSGSQNAYVNLVTHLAFEREQALLATESFSDAVAQAEKELRSQIAVGGPTFDPGAIGSQMNLLEGDTVQAAYLFAVGSVFAEAANLSTAAGSEDAKLQQLVNTAASNLASAGTLPTATTTLLAQAQQCIEPDVYVASLQSYLTESGATTVVPNINRALDSDLDGIPNILDDCLLVANPAQDIINDAICNYRRGATTPSQSVADAGAAFVRPGAVAGDLDGVHGADLVSFGMGEIDAWLNDGSGNFGQAIVTSGAVAGLSGFAPPYNYPLGLATADMNGDTHIDLVVAFGSYPKGQGVTVGYLPGDGTGAFGGFVQLFVSDMDTMDTMFGLVLEDFNGDERLDIAGAHSTGVAIALAPATGAWPGFGPTMTFPANPGASVEGFALADMNEDGNPDLVLAAVSDGPAAGNAGIGVLFGAGDGTFPTSSTYVSSFGTAATGVAVGDVDGDHHVDIIASAPNPNSPVNGVSTVGFGAGDGTISATTILSAPVAPQCFAGGVAPAGTSSVITGFVVADFTGDAKADIFLTQLNSMAVSHGRTLAAPVPFASVSPVPLATGVNGSFAVDLNGDGIADFGFANGTTVGYVLVNSAGYRSW